MNIDTHITAITVTLIIIIDAWFLGIIMIIVISNRRCPSYNRES